MAHYRIVKTTIIDGIVHYNPQFRVLWIFWSNFSTGRYDWVKEEYIVHSFTNQKDAAKFLDDHIEKKRKQKLYPIHEVIPYP